MPSSAPRATAGATSALECAGRFLPGKGRRCSAAHVHRSRSDGCCELQGVDRSPLIVVPPSKRAVSLERPIRRAEDGRHPEAAAREQVPRHLPTHFVDLREDRGYVLDAELQPQSDIGGKRLV